MPRNVKLLKHEVEEQIKKFPLWMTDENISIYREITAKNFPAAIGIVNSVALIAEKLNHHPEILIYGWNKVKITLFTWDAKGLTELDFKLAKLIDELGF